MYSVLSKLALLVFLLTTQASFAQNRIQDPFSFKDTQNSKQYPIPKITLVSSTNKHASTPKPFSGFVFPLILPRVSSGFGMRIHPIKRYSKQHQGIDLAAPTGTIIRAIGGGIVVFADKYAGLGNLVVIKHNNGKLVTRYGHCNGIKVRPGQSVKAGQIIATVGSTGHSTGPHLHLETIYEGQVYNPEILLPGLGDEGDG